MDGIRKYSSKPEHDLSFSSFIFSVSGWAGMESWLLSGDAPLGAHLATSFFGVVLTTVSVRSCSRYRGHIQKNHASKNSSSVGLSPRDVGAIILLMAIGFILGCLSSSRFSVPFIPIVTGVMLVPWLRFTFCNQSPTSSYLAVAFGVMIAMLGPNERSPSLFIPIANWMLWTCACVSLLQHLMSAKKWDSTAQAGYENVKGTSSTNTNLGLRAGTDL